MKKVFLDTLSIKWLIISVIMGLLSYFAYSIHQVFFNEQEYSYNRYLIPLGNRQVYFLKKGITENQSTFYYIQPENEPNPTESKTGYSVGKSSVDLEPFVNKKVYIYGDVQEGYVLRISPQNDPTLPPDRVISDQHTTEQMVLNIKKILTLE